MQQEACIPDREFLCKVLLLQDTLKKVEEDTNN